MCVFVCVWATNGTGVSSWVTVPRPVQWRMSFFEFEPEVFGQDAASAQPLRGSGNQANYFSFSFSFFLANHRILVRSLIRNQIENRSCESEKRNTPSFPIAIAFLIPRKNTLLLTPDLNTLNGNNSDVSQDSR